MHTIIKKVGEAETVKVVERINGQRIYREFQPDLHFFVSDARGQHKSIYGDALKKIIPKSIEERFKTIKSLSHNVKVWETNVNPVYRCLEQNYQNSELPTPHVAFFDIETSFDKELGWSGASEANNFITAISVHCQWKDEIICISVPPETITAEEAQSIADEVGNTIICKTELEMLQLFIEIIEDADILSGWNSGCYDIPYLINRMKKVLGRHEVRKLCLWNLEPHARMIDRGGKEVPTYDLIGRVHMDYMELYKKYNYEERHSYALNAIAELEVGDTKIPYEGTLDELFNCDYKKFLQYNIQDTLLLDKIDKKLQFIDLASSIAHSNCVTLMATAGAVAVTDQAIMIEAHNRNMIVMDRSQFSNGETRAAGGWVATPKIGFHRWIGTTDMKSLYPSVIRAFNMSPETIVGQIRLDRTNKALLEWESKGGTNDFAHWWNDRFNVLEMEYFYDNDISEKLILDMTNGDVFEVTGAELRDIIFESEQGWCISANGTIFRTDIEGVIPGLLSRWYSERKQLQKIMVNYQGLEDNEKIEGVLVPEELFTNKDISDIEVKANPYNEHESYNPSKLSKLISTGIKEDIVQYMNQHHLHIKDGKAIHRDQKELKKYIGFWDKKQAVKKISLNSLYRCSIKFRLQIFRSTTWSISHLIRQNNYETYGSSNE